MNYRTVIPVLAASAMLLAGCAGLVVVDANPGPRAQYFDGDFEFATRNGAIKTIIVGNPFGGDKAALDRHIRAYMRNNTFGPPVEFIDRYDKRTDRRYRVVVAFNIPATTTDHDLCAKGPDTPVEETGDRIRVNMAFCIENDLKSGISGSAPQVASAAAPQFQELIVQTTRSLIPHQDLLDQGEAEVRP